MRRRQSATIPPCRLVAVPVRLAMGGCVLSGALAQNLVELVGEPCAEIRGLRLFGRKKIADRAFAIVRLPDGADQVAQPRRRVMESRSFSSRRRPAPSGSQSRW